MLLDSISRLAKNAHQIQGGLNVLLSSANEKEPLKEKEFDMENMSHRSDDLSKKLEKINKDISQFKLRERKQYRDIIHYLRYYNMLTKHLAEDMDEINSSIAVGNRMTDEMAFTRLADTLWILDKTVQEIEHYLGTLNRRKH